MNPFAEVFWIIYKLFCGRNMPTLSLYNVICAVEPADVWKPEANPYESGNFARSASYLPPLNKK